MLQVWRRYNGRADVENRIKELGDQFGIKRLPSGARATNVLLVNSFETSADLLRFTRNNLVGIPSVFCFGFPIPLA